MTTYFGTSDHTLDEKGRLILPGRIVDKVAKEEWGWFLSAGLDRCLLLHDAAGWAELTQRLGQSVPGSRAHRALCRRFLGHSEKVVPDSTKRIRIPDALMQYAGLEASKGVVLVSTGKVTEIWAPGNLSTSLAEATVDEETLFAELIGTSKPSVSLGT